MSQWTASDHSWAFPAAQPAGLRKESSCMGQKEGADSEVTKKSLAHLLP